MRHKLGYLAYSAAQLGFKERSKYTEIVKGCSGYARGVLRMLRHV